MNIPSTDARRPTSDAGRRGDRYIPRTFFGSGDKIINSAKSESKSVVEYEFDNRLGRV